MALFHCMVRRGTVRYGSLLGGFPLGTVPGTRYFFSTTSVEVPCEPYRYQNVTCKLYWSLIGRRESSLLRQWTCDTRPSYLDLNQHSQRGIRRSIWLNKRNFSTKEWLFRGLLRKYRRSSHWSLRSGSSESLMVRRGMKKFFIDSWFVMSPSLTSHYTWIDYTCASRHIRQSVPQSVKINTTEFLWKWIVIFLIKSMRKKTNKNKNNI